MTAIRSAETWGTFHLTAEAVSVEGCEAGELTRWGDLADEYSESCWDLRDVVELFGRGYRPEGDGDRVPRWLTFEASSNDLLMPADGWAFLSELICGEEAIGGSICVHRPGWMTEASWVRFCRLLGWRG